MSSWVIWAVGLVVVVAVVVLIVLVRHRAAVKATAPDDLPVVSRAPAVLGEAPVQPIDPVMPAEQARGYGWMKASDLIGQKPEN